MQPTLILIAVIVLAIILAIMTFNRLICICQPNEVLIFSGFKRRIAGRRLGYKLVIGGRKMRIPLLERVDRMDLTNMIIDLHVVNAYSKGGIPLTVQGVANMKIASQEPVLNNAIERFLGMGRSQIMNIAKATVEGSLRGVLATMTPQQVNEDKLLFAERLVLDAAQDMTNLGLVIDNLKIQNVQDDMAYLDSIGRKQSAEIVRKARIAEAIAKADAIVRAAENREKEVRAQIMAQIQVANADAQRRLTEVRTRRDALVAEEQATVAAEVAKSNADVEVQKARVEQIKQMLEADVIQPAKASCEAAEARAKADAAPIIEDGKARATVLQTLAESWRAAGPNAREIFLLQKLDDVVQILASIIAETRVENVTMIDSRTPDLTEDGSLPVKAVSTLEQIKRIFGVDLLERLKPV